MSLKRKALSLEEKMNILREVDKNSSMSKVDIARKLEINVSTLKTLIYKREEIEKNASASNSTVAKRQRVRPGKFPEIDELVLEFFKQCRAANIPVSGPMLINKALEIGRKMEVKDCLFSAGWLHKFKIRNGITCHMLSGESKSVPLETVEEWFKILPDKIAGYEPKNIFNCDETGLFYHLLPSRTLSVKGEPCYGAKKSKERLTILLCTNSDGSEKLTPFVVGKYKNPRCFKNIKTLPVLYDFNKKAWMTGKIFTEWLMKLDKKMVQEKRKIILFMDQCPSHPPDTKFLKNVEIAFFPANCTSHVQPLDLGIIRCFKHQYRQKLVQLAVEHISDGNVKKVNVLEAMNFISSAWNQVSKQTIQNCFIKAGYPFREEEVPAGEIELESNTEWHLLNCDHSFEEYADCDNDVLTTNVLSVEELIACNNPTESSSSEDDNDDETNVVPPTFLQAVSYCDELRKFFLCNETSEKTLHQLNDIQNELYNINRNSSRQKSMTDFFSPCGKKKINKFIICGYIFYIIILIFV